MCGICGIFQLKKNNKKNINQVLNKINHRGPDASGIWNDNNISLGSVRLKVVDYNQASNQPFLSNNKKYIIVFNGEIYNFAKLKTKHNIKTKTDSDTEVIVELFSKFGPKIFSLLEGMFAISIYDINNSKLYLARDGFGIKPLYFFKNKTKLIFCSEIKGILTQLKHRIPNYRSVLDFIKWGGIDHSDETWFKDIMNVEQGSYYLFKKDLTFKKYKFYKLEENLNKYSYKKKEIPLKFNSLLKDSIKEQSQTVRSIGTNLSGGVDSSIVTSYLKEINNDINTYTFGYKEKEYDERPYSLEVARKLGIKNYVSVTTPKDINKNFLDVLLMQDEPFTSFRQISHHKLYEDYKKEGSTVILESSGGDEIGAGYTGFIWPFFLEQSKKIGFEKAWSHLIKILKFHNFDSNKIYQFINSSIFNQKYYGSTTSDGQKIINDNCIIDSFDKKHNGKPILYKKKFKNNLLNSQYIELFHTKLPRGLRYVDRASSSSGREARVPLLNKDIVEFCFSIPDELKINNNELRWFMKKSLVNLDKKEILLGNKRSIADPQRIWIRKDFSKLFMKVFKSKTFKERGIFNQNQVLVMFKNFLKNKNAHSLGVFQIFISEIWFRLFIDNSSIDYKGEKLSNFISETN